MDGVTGDEGTPFERNTGRICPSSLSVSIWSRIVGGTVKRSGWGRILWVDGDSTGLVSSGVDTYTAGGDADGDCAGDGLVDDWRSDVFANDGRRQEAATACLAGGACASTEVPRRAPPLRTAAAEIGVTDDADTFERSALRQLEDTAALPTGIADVSLPPKWKE